MAVYSRFRTCPQRQMAAKAEKSENSGNKRDVLPLLPLHVDGYEMNYFML